MAPSMKELFFIHLFQFEMEQDHSDAGTEIERCEQDEQITEKSPASIVDILDGEIGE
jgi:hypothetical protein